MGESIDWVGKTIVRGDKMTLAPMMSGIDINSIKTSLGVKIEDEKKIKSEKKSKTEKKSKDNTKTIESF